MPLRFGRHRGGGLFTPTPPATVFVPVDYGPRFNDWVSYKTSGAGGDYPDGTVPLPGGDYYVDPFDLSTGEYARAFDASKPNNNWLTITEADGPGTVTFDLSPESAATVLGQTTTEAYNDTLHGGAFRNVVVDNGEGTAGSFRWCFDGGFTFANGAIFLAQRITGGVAPAERLIFHGTSHYFSIEEWRRQFDIVRSIMGVANPGYTIPDTATYQAVEFSPKMKHNFFPDAFRGGGMEHIYILRCDLGPHGDDAVFLGGNYIDIIGTVIHEVLDRGVAPDMHHPNTTQSAGGHHIRIIDCTYNGKMEMTANNGDLTDCIFDRIWQGASGIVGNEAYAIHGHTVAATVQYGSGAPTTRLSGHFFKGFGNGTDYPGSGGAQGGLVDNGNQGYRWVLVNWTDPRNLATVSNVSVAIPTGCTVDSNGFLNNGLATFLGSTDAPHQQFRAAYATTELADVMADYGIAFD